MDNHDSFTYNLFQLFDEHELCEVTVLQSDAITVEDLLPFDQIVLSPGPDVPQHYPILFDIIERYKGVKPILGVCLGHQTIGVYFGGKLVNLSKVYHGQVGQINQLETADYLFSKVNFPMAVGLYHSWALPVESLPACLRVLAKSTDGVVMSIAHKEYNIRGIQFHPESYMTKEGHQLIDAWLTLG